MLKSQLAAYRKAFACKVSNPDLDVGQFIMSAQTSAFYEFATRWQHDAPINVRDAQQFKLACKNIVAIVERGYDANRDEWWIVPNFKALASLQIQLAHFGTMLESLPGTGLEWKQVKREFIAFIEIFCGLSWREQSAKLQQFVKQAMLQAA